MSAAPRALTVRAYAKINAYLDVVRKRPDGYHDLDTEMVAISLCDVLTLAPRDAPGVELTVAPPDPRLVGPDHLILRAAALLLRETGGRLGATIELRKRRPVQAGLGGGSSDAASALHGLNRLWRLRLPLDRLMALGAGLGSDVPFFVAGSGRSACGGRGEIVAPCPPGQARGLVLASPHIPTPTAAVFRELRPDDYPVGRSANALQAPAERLFPDIRRVRERLEQATGRAFMLSGSGPTLFTWADAPDVRRRLVRTIRQCGVRCWSVRSVARTYRFEVSDSRLG